MARSETFPRNLRKLPVSTLHGILLIVVGSFVSCAPARSSLMTRAVRVSIDAINDPMLEDRRTYVLYSSKQDVDVTDLQFREFADQVKRVLALRGYSESPDPSLADMAVFLNYGIGDPQTAHFSYSLPVYGQIGGGASTVKFNTYGSGGYSTTTGQIYQAPKFGVVGTETHSGTAVTYLRFFVLDALDLTTFRRSKKIVPVWKATVTSRGIHDDLREFFPYMVSGSSEYLGGNTGSRVSVVVEDREAREQQVLDGRIRAPTPGSPVTVLFSNGETFSGIFTRANNNYIYILPENSVNRSIGEKAFKLETVEDILDSEQSANVRPLPSTKQ